MHKLNFLSLLILIFFLAACSSPIFQPEPTATPVPTATSIPTATPHPTEAPEGYIGGWELVWQDEFDGPEIDMGKWSACAEDTESEEYKTASASVDADMALGQKLGVSGTPGFFVNGEFLKGAQPLAAFEPLIEKAKSGS